MNKDTNLIVIGLIAFLLFLALFVMDYVDLEKFKACYDIGFQSEACERYRDY